MHNQKVFLNNGQEVDYDKVLIATGHHSLYSHITRAVLRLVWPFDGIVQN